MLSAAIDWFKHLLGSAGSDSDGSDVTDETDESSGPDLYECEGCGTVFISRPNQCSTCENDEDLSNVGKFS